MFNRNSHGSSDHEVNWLWRSVLVFTVVTLGWRFLISTTGSLFGPDNEVLNRFIAGVLASVLTYSIVALACRFLDRGAWGNLQFTPLRSGFKPLLVGMVCWLIPAGICVGLFVLFGWTDIALHTPIGEVLLSVGQLLVIVFLSEALPEELVFRGYFYHVLSLRLPQWSAILGQATLFTGFGVLIGAAGSIDRIAFFFVFAVVLGIFRVVTGNLWAPIGFHLVFQTTTQFFGSVHGQVSAVPLGALVAVGFAWIPFVIGSLLVMTFYRRSPRWEHQELPPAL